MSQSVGTIEPFAEIRAATIQRQAVRPSSREWALHSLLFFLTVITTTFAGIANAAPAVDPPAPPLSAVLDYFLYVPEYYRRTSVAQLSFAFDPHMLAAG